MGYETTHETADRLIGAERRTQAEQAQSALKVDHIQEAHKAGYGYAVNDLEACAINLRAYSRNMIARDALPSYIKHAREALDRIEQALVR